VLVSFDTKLRRRLWPLDRARAVMTDVLRRCDIALPGDHDLTALSGLTAPDASVDHCLALGGRTVTLKLGAEGALLADARKRHHIPPFPCTPVDATGAGDTFGGAFVARRVAGDSLLDAGRCAAAAAALSTPAYGAVAPIPHAAAVRAALAGAR
jgi:2-dehydro-3-deoxygluconokinase